jgi:hypothetical protein
MLQYAHPDFPQTMSRNHFDAICQTWHLSDNGQRMWLRQPIQNSTYEYFLPMFTSVYRPQKSSHWMNAIPWRGHLKFKAYAVCEARSGYISNMDIRTPNEKSMKRQFYLFCKIIIPLNHHIYQDNFYNSVKLYENWLQRNTRVCDAMRMNIWTAQDPAWEAELATKSQSLFLHITRDILVYVWEGIWVVCVISTVH